MKKKHVIFISIIVIIVLSSIAMYAFKSNKDSAANKTAKIALYTVPDKEKIFVNGVIIPEKSENIFLDSTKGNVNKVSVTNGQVVKKGYILFTYKNDLITDQIEQLNKQVTSTNNQKKQLVDKQAEAKQIPGTEVQISSYRDQIDSLQNQINTYQDQIKTLKAKEYTSITAPLDGKVLLNDSEKDPTKPFIVMETTSFYIKGNINEKDQPKLKANQSAEILVFSTNKTITGKVKSIGNRPATAELSAQAAVSGSSNISYYDVNISMDSQENITNGFHVQATVNLTVDSIKIPKSSIVEEADKKYVFKVVDKKLTKQEITYEESTSTDVVVSSGLKETDSIAVDTKDMKEGMSVE